ncbi:MAG: hypothetical protein JWN94_729 [Betaproteobacteria bacterium]|nr:hypothetical protein [Betaproteobacteria bacterium]
MASPDEVQPESLKDEVHNLIEEARMVLPGIQALFGFQLIAVFNDRFEQLAELAQMLHLCATLMVALSVLLIMTPAAYHRIAEPDAVSRRFTRLASKSIALAMIPFALAMSIEIAIITHIVTASVRAAVATSVIAAIASMGAWFAWPLLARHPRKAPAK